LSNRQGTLASDFELGNGEHFPAFGWRSGFTAAIKWEKIRAASAAEVLSMAAPRRGNTGCSCYFITASAFQKRNILQSDRMAALFVEVLLHYHAQGKYLLHEFVVMPDHFHLLITPRQSLERAMQLIKGGFSFRAKRDLGFMYEIWQPSFYDRRVRSVEQYLAFREYIRRNAIKRGLAVSAEDYRFSSAWPGIVLDEAPQRLKPAKLLERLNRSGKPLRHPKSLC
jgi:putative transposase